MYANYKIYIVLTIVSYLIFSSNSSSEYGYVKVIISNIETCRGPKRKDCCVSAATVKDNVLLTYDFLVKESFKLTSGKIVATANNKEMVKFQMKTPCEHFLVKSLFKMYLNITEKCIVTKGHYVFSNNVQDLSEKYYGGKYFYGNWTFKSIFYGNECNFFCTVMSVAMIPRNKH